LLTLFAGGHTSSPTQPTSAPTNDIKLEMCVVECVRVVCAVRVVRVNLLRRLSAQVKAPRVSQLERGGGRLESEDLECCVCLSQPQRTPRVHWPKLRH
jgi:hypothetical protein